MPRVGFEPTIPAFERAKTYHALDRAVTVTGWFSITTVYSLSGNAAYITASYN
jgi:hypothetical protein